MLFVGGDAGFVLFSLDPSHGWSPAGVPLAGALRRAAWEFDGSVAHLILVGKGGRILHARSPAAHP